MAHHSNSGITTNASVRTRPLRVYLLDLWCFIPYYLAALSSALRAASVNVTLGTVRYHLDRNYFDQIGVDTDAWLIDVGGAIPYAALRRIVKSIEYVANILMLLIRLTLAPPDVLHVQFLPFLERGFSFELWFLRFVRRRNVPVVVTVHNLPNRNAQSRDVLYRDLYSQADALIFHGREARDYITARLSIDPGKMWVIPHGPLFEQLCKESPAEAREKLGLPAGDPLVLCLGVISEYKGIPFLIDAWKQHAEAGGQGKLVIAGSGDPQLLAEIENRVAVHDLASSVELRLRFIPVELLPLFYQAADIHIYPYKAGTTSGALLSGLNYGKAIIATQLPLFQELMSDEENALLVPYGDTERMASAIGRLVEDSALRERLARGVAALNKKRESWRDIAGATLQCYETIAGFPSRE